MWIITNPKKYIKKGLLPDKRILGIPTSFTDSIEQFMSLNSIYHAIEPIILKNLYEDGSKDDMFYFNQSFSITTHLNLEFVEETFEYDYYSSQDIFSALGGIGAMVNLCLSLLSFIFIYQYIWSLV